MSGRHSDTSGDGGEEVGSLAEEAAKLIGALSDWAHENGSGAGPLAGGLADEIADRASRAAHDAGEHLAADAPECTVCPVCRAVRAFRQLSPEVRGHLSVAASSLVQAAAGVMATVVPDGDEAQGVPGDEHAGRRRAEPVEKIVLDEDRTEESS